MASEFEAQKFVHSLEHGKGRWWVIFGLILTTAAVLFTCFLFMHVFRAALKTDPSPIFRGLSHAKGMEQAVIARELARGNGFSTKVIKPAAVELANSKHKDEAYFQRILEGKTESRGNIPDIYHAPLNPWLNSIALRIMVSINNATKWHANAEGQADFWFYKPTEFVHTADKTIAGLASLFFFGALIFNYFTISWLFDRRLAVLTILLLLLCQLFWDFATTGLPQLLLLFLFSGATMCLTQALMARSKEKWTWPWICGAGLCFGLMALAHAITLWLLVGAVIYLALGFRPIGRNAAIFLGLAVLLFSPWLIRNSKVSGDARGLSWQTKNYQIDGTESQIMRTMKPDVTRTEQVAGINKLMGQILLQLDTLYQRLGKLPTAPLFFLALLQAFRKRETRSLRWGLACMWIFGVLGMAYFGFGDNDGFTTIQSNDIHLLFVPLFAAYGLALLLNMWSRVEAEGRNLSSIPFLNTAVTSAIVILSAFPLVSRYTTPPDSIVVYPPYFPPYLTELNNLYSEKEIICSDMPWAVAWFADRRSLWLPMSLRDFNRLNTDFNDRITALLFTPMSGYKGFLSDITTGEFAEWSLFIMRDPRVQKNFPLSVIRKLPIGGGIPYFLYSDRDRWTERQ